MQIHSLLPPVAFQSVVSGRWFIVTTDPKLGWVEVDRKYSWEELNKMWIKDKFKNTTKEVVILPKPTPKQTFSVEGSKGKIYEVINNAGKWSCSCPAFGFSRGNGCKHITQLKNNP
jgi:hypothetical protein